MKKILLVLAFVAVGCAAQQTKAPVIKSGQYTPAGCLLRWTGITWLVSLGEAQGPGGKCNVTDEAPKWKNNEWSCRKNFTLTEPALYGNNFVEAGNDRYDKNAQLTCRKIF